MKILRVLTRPNLGGPTRQACALWHAHDAAGHETLLATGVCEAGEPALALDVPRRAHVSVPSMRRSLSPWRDRAARRQLLRVVRDFAPDVIHTHTSKAGMIGRPLARRLGIPVAHTYHGIVLRDYYPRWISYWMARAEARLARMTNRNFAVSESCVRELAEFGIDADVVRPAVALRTTDRGRARAALGLDDEVFALGFIGRLVPIKRVADFAAALLRVPDAIGVVIGDGPERHELEGIPGLRHVGARADGPDLVAAFDVLVMPSRREGFPLAVVEATAAGVPSVGYDVPGVADAIGAAGGELVDPRDGPPGLARAIAAVRGRRPSSELVESCDPVRVAACLIEAYESMLDA